MLATARDEALLLGRDRERSFLSSLLDEVSIRGQALVLLGEPGVDKSRLLSDTDAAAGSDGRTACGG